jgi:hypothetical protein
MEKLQCIRSAAATDVVFRFRCRPAGVRFCPGRSDDGMIWQVKKPADLFEAEERLRASVAAGVKLSLGDRVPRGRGGRCPTHKKIRADAILAVLRAVQEPSRSGIVLWVEGACIIGTLDLCHARLTMPVIMKHCSFDGRVDLSEAHAVSVSLSGSRSRRSAATDSRSTETLTFPGAVQGRSTSSAPGSADGCGLPVQNSAGLDPAMRSMRLT